MTYLLKARITQLLSLAGMKVCYVLYGPRHTRRGRSIPGAKRRLLPRRVLSNASHLTIPHLKVRFVPTSSVFRKRKDDVEGRVRLTYTEELKDVVALIAEKWTRANITSPQASIGSGVDRDYRKRLGGSVPLSLNFFSHL